MQTYQLVIHGGAGTILQKNITPEKELEYKKALETALITGKKLLENGLSAIEAVEQAVIALEDSPLFNAGKGSVFNSKGENEMEASIMDGQNKKAGAVAAIQNIKNPIALARKIMEHSEFVYLAGNDALLFAQSQDLDFAPKKYFHTDYRYNQWQAIKNNDTMLLDHDSDRKFGTVGAVALDIHGNLAAATSTGGLTNKKFGRLGDSSVIGAGTYANNNTCAISCTGYGEFFIRAVVAYDISCLMEYKGLSLIEASKLVVHDKLIKIGGEGGIIGVDKLGNIAMEFNSDGMYRGFANNDNLETHIYK